MSEDWAAITKVGTESHVEKVAFELRPVAIWGKGMLA